MELSLFFVMIQKQKSQNFSDSNNLKFLHIVEMGETKKKLIDFEQNIELKSMI